MNGSIGAIQCNFVKTTYYLLVYTVYGFYFNFGTVVINVKDKKCVPNIYLNSSDYF